MNGFAEQRMYQRCDNMVYEATVSRGDAQWLNTELYDISAVGLRFGSEHTFKLGDKLSINLDFYNMLSKFNIMLKGLIIRMDRKGGKPVYVVKFVDVDKNSQVQLDELVRNCLSLCCSEESVLPREHLQQHVLPKFELKNEKLSK